MCNFYTEFYESIVDLTEEELGWWKEQEQKVVDVMENTPEVYDQDESICVDFVLVDQKREVLFISDECGEPERVANIVHEFLKIYRPNEYFALEWCSHGDDEVGGGAFFVTKDGIEWMCTAEWIDAKRSILKTRENFDNSRN